MATLEERIAALELKMAALAMPEDYYVSQYSGEEADEALAAVREGNLVIPSSTEGSTKRFRIAVDDSGALSAKEVTA